MMIHAKIVSIALAEVSNPEYLKNVILCCKDACHNCVGHQISMKGRKL